MQEEIIIDECFNCKKKKDIGDNWRTCKLKCSYKYKRKENDYITRLEQENKELKEENSLLSYNLHIKENEAAHYLKEVSRHRSALEEINRVVKLAYKVEDYLLGQDYTDLVDRIEKELEVLNEG